MRVLPWRNTNDPYPIWLSEIILQQTRVQQGLPYYESFLKQFPKVSDLARASQDEVLKLWEGLGYYSRARNLHEAAKYIHEELNDVFPGDYKSLLTLKGVGPYTAAAVASFAFGEQIAVVDGNVYRVLARFFGLEMDISSSKAHNYFQNIAQNLLEEGEDPALFNQAIMDFGAMQCTPKNPLCETCPFEAQCVAKADNKINILPVKLSKTKVIDRYFDYIITQDAQQKYLVNQRLSSGIWQNLFEFPLIENAVKLPLETVEEQIKLEYNSYDIQQLFAFDSEYQVHKLSHQRLYIRFWKLEVGDNLKGYDKDCLLNFAYPIVLVNFIQKNWLKI